MIHPQLVPHATMLVYILTDAAIEPAVLDSVSARRHRGQLQSHLRRRRHLHQRHRAAAGLRRERCGSRRRTMRSLPPRSRRSAPRWHARSSPTAKAFRTSSSCASTAPPPTPTRCASPRPSLIRRWSRPRGPAAIPTGDVSWRPSATPAPQIDPRTLSTSPLASCPSAATADAPPSTTKPPHTPTSSSRSSLSPSISTRASGSCVFWTTDLTHEYIRINADYTT